jgi:peptidyl-prolyl cis-trans isomerase C
MKSLKGLRLIAVTASAIALQTSPVFAEAVATVNGVEIERSVFENYLESRTQKSLAEVTPEERNLVMQELSDIYLLSSQPRAKELAETDRVKAQMELQKRGLLAQTVATDFLSSNTATEDEIFAEYTKQIEQSASEQFKARHILVETQSKAEELIAQLKTGADFAELAKANSTGPSGPSGGDLGWFPPDQMVTPFSEAVVALEDGAFTEEPVQTQFGWHVILREDSRANEPPTLESVRDIVKQQVEALKFQSYLESLRAAEDNE